jgi:hypothetical protein
LDADSNKRDAGAPGAADRQTRAIVALGPCARHVALATMLILLAGLPALAYATAPQWGRCEAPVAGGPARYEDAGCTQRAHRGPNGHVGRYEWHPLLAHQRLVLNQLALESAVRFQTANGVLIECSSVGPEGEQRPNGPKGALTPLWELEGCEAEGQECHSFAAALLGEIGTLFQWLEEPVQLGGPTPGWTGRLGWISRNPVKVGIQYTANNHERLLDPISCRGSLGIVSIGGDPRQTQAIIATVTPLNTMTSQITETYSQSSPGRPDPSKLEHHGPATAIAFIERTSEQIAISATFRYQLEGGHRQLELRALP